ncbi:C-X-C motif chemokine 11 [Pogona vitticeps]|nr:C-X-C motif chemokine 11-like [Pogona vitticeps]
MKPFLAILCLFLCAALIQGMPTSSRGRCLCRGRPLSGVNMGNVAELEYHRPGPSCDVEELIVCFKRNGNRACLDLNKPQGRAIKEAIMRKKK